MKRVKKARTRTQLDHLCTCGLKFANRASLTLHTSTMPGHVPLRVNRGREEYGEKNGWSEDSQYYKKTKQTKKKPPQKGYGKTKPEGR